MAKVKEGIIIYTIGKDGCLNGIYTNEQANGIIYNEVARMDVPHVGDNIAGVYSGFHFDLNNARIDTIIHVDRKIGNPRILEFKWVDANTGTGLFKGVGYEMTEKLVAVHYTSM